MFFKRSPLEKKISTPLNDVYTRVQKCRTLTDTPVLFVRRTKTNTHAQLPFKCFGLCAVTISDVLYLFCGWLCGAHRKHFFNYISVYNVWTHARPFPAWNYEYVCLVLLSEPTYTVIYTRIFVGSLGLPDHISCRIMCWWWLHRYSYTDLL